MPIDLFACLRVLPTDYDAYGGEVKRWSDPDVDYPDCSGGCKFFVPLADELRYDWGVCSKPGGRVRGSLRGSTKLASAALNLTSSPTQADHARTSA